MTATADPGHARTVGIACDPFAGRAVAVVEDLRLLCPHDVGQLRLPLHLDGYVPATWDLTQVWARQEIAETVLAHTPHSAPGPVSAPAG